MNDIFVCFYGKCAYSSQRRISRIIYLNNRDDRGICFYDPDTNNFYGTDMKPMSIHHKIIIPVCDIYSEEIILEKINEFGGIIPCGFEKNKNVVNWPLFYRTKRKCEIVHGKDLIDSNILDILEKKYGSEIFFKTLEKQYSDIVKINDLRNKNSLIHTVLSMHENDEFIISEVVDIMDDEIGNKEYRVFVFDGRIISISRATEFILHQINPIIYKKVQEIVKYMSSLDFPTAYVFDLFEYKDVNNEVVIDVVEFNPYIASGRYLYNSIDYVPQSDILHEDIYAVAPEFKNLINFCRMPDIKYKSMLSASKVYSKEGSFAYDLKKISEYNSKMVNDDNFDLGKDVSSYIDSYMKNQNSHLNSKLSIIERIVLDASDSLNESLKECFLESLSLCECPSEPVYLFTSYVRDQIFDDCEKVSNGFVKVNPKILKYIKKSDE